MEKVKMLPNSIFHLYFIWSLFFSQCSVQCTMHNLNEKQEQLYRGYLGVFLVKDQNLFHRVDTIGNIFTSGAATSENITDGVHEMK